MRFISIAAALLLAMLATPAGGFVPFIGVADALADVPFHVFIGSAPVATTPLSPTDLIPIIQGGVTKSATASSLQPDAMNLESLVIAKSPGIFSLYPHKQVEPSMTYMMNANGSVPGVMSATASMPLVWLKQTGALVGQGVNTSISGFEVNYNDTGTVAHNDSFVGITGNCNLMAPRPSLGVDGGSLAAACVGTVAAARGLEYQGGNIADNQPQGEIHGLNVVAGLSHGTTIPHDYVDATGIEVDIVGCAGCTMLNRFGILSVDFGDGHGGLVEQGTKFDAAFAVVTVAGGVGWRYGIDFPVGAPLTTGFPLSNDGTALGSSAPMVNAANGIDFHNWNISNGVFRGPNDAFFVTGPGDVVMRSGNATLGFTVDTPAANNAWMDYRADGTAKWAAGRQGGTNDFVIENLTTHNVMLRSTNAGATSIGGISNGITVDASGALFMAGVSTATGSITGSLCFDGGTKQVIYKAGANCL